MLVESRRGSIPEVKDREIRDTISELEEASFVLQADALQVRYIVHMYVYTYVSFVFQDVLNPCPRRHTLIQAIQKRVTSGRGNLNGYSLERGEIPAQIE